MPLDDDLEFADDAVLGKFPRGERVVVQTGPNSTMSAYVPPGRQNTVVDLGGGRSMSFARSTGIPVSIGILLEKIHTNAK